MSDHMLIAHFSHDSGWTKPEIVPYAPLSLDPASSCFQYCPSVFEGMKAYLGSDGKPRLFRPQLNMARMERSAARVALPVSDRINLVLALVLIDIRFYHMPIFSNASNGSLRSSRGGFLLRLADLCTLDQLSLELRPI